MHACPQDVKYVPSQQNNDFKDIFAILQIGPVLIANEVIITLNAVGAEALLYIAHGAPGSILPRPRPLSEQNTCNSDC